jgi:hypothetical protein
MEMAAIRGVMPVPDAEGGIPLPLSSATSATKSANSGHPN